MLVIVANIAVAKLKTFQASAVEPDDKWPDQLLNSGARWCVRPVEMWPTCSVITPISVHVGCFLMI